MVLPPTPATDPSKSLHSSREQKLAPVSGFPRTIPVLSGPFPNVDGAAETDTDGRLGATPSNSRMFSPSHLGLLYTFDHPCGITGPPITWTLRGNEFPREAQGCHLKVLRTLARQTSFVELGWVDWASIGDI